MDKPRLDQGPDYERGFIDGMMYQTQTTVNKAVDAMSKRTTNDCPDCEYHKKRAQHWREEAYKQAGHPLPEREWVGLTYEEQRELYKKHDMDGWGHFYNAIEAKLKEKNYG
jgi:hypothetical protein